MIVGTAGHIDHGKSALIRALTGVDTDRLPEEKARGISIELGYAYLDVPGAADRLGFVDVPGHERLVRTMLAGATGIDSALLVVAADDGVMPQTREHLAVLSLLGLVRGRVALTKIDRVAAARVAEVRAQVDALLAGTALGGAPSYPVSPVTGEGVEALRSALFDDARAWATEREAAGAALSEPLGFRLAVDRSFTLVGIGTVVTGTVHAGRVAVGDELAVVPTAGRDRRVRVRSLHVADRPARQAGAGTRCALALAGVERDQVGRGQWLVTPSIALSTLRIDARITVWQGEPRPLRNGTTVHVHLGTADVFASVAVLRVEGPEPVAPLGADPTPLGPSLSKPGWRFAAPPSTEFGPGFDELGANAVADAVPPGRSAWVQLVLRAPVAAWHGDRLVLRDASASRTVAGGSVLDPSAPTRHRRTPERLAELAAQLRSTADARREALILAAPLGVSLDRWTLAEGLAPVDAPAANDAPPAPPFGPKLSKPGSHALAPAADLPASGGPAYPSVIEDGWCLAARHAAPIEQRALEALRAFHDRHPSLPGLDPAALRRLVAPRLPEPLWRALMARTRASGRLGLQASFAYLPERAEAASKADAATLAAVMPRLARAGREGAWVRELARAIGQTEAAMRASLARLARQGVLHQVVDDLYWQADTIVELAGIARDVAAAANGELTAAAFRDATGLGRKRAIQLLEYFDRVGLSRRVGDARRLRSDTRLFETG